VKRFEEDAGAGKDVVVAELVGAERPKSARTPEVAKRATTAQARRWFLVWSSRGTLLCRHNTQAR
jgi:hypothetical protein